MTTNNISYELQREIEQFIFLESRLADACEYRDWEDLWTDDGVYWVPANGNDTDPETGMSIIHDHRSRIALRVNQYYTGKRFTADPQSSLRRVVSNFEILSAEGDEIRVASNAIVFESNDRIENIWASRNEHLLRRVEGRLKMARKTIMLVNNNKALDTISFLI